MSVDPIDAGVADMENMRGGRLDDDRTQGTNVTPVLLVRELASPGLRMEPGIRRSQYALRRRLHRPGFRRAVVIGQKSFDGRLAGNPADGAAADTIREDDGDALHAQQRLFRNQNAIKILIGLFATLIRILSDRNFQFAWHQRGPNEKGLNL